MKQQNPLIIFFPQPVSPWTKTFPAEA